MKCIKEIAGLSTDYCKVYRDSIWNEYRVKFGNMINGQWIPLRNADYHTTDKQDALDTAEAWVTQQDNLRRQMGVK